MLPKGFVSKKLLILVTLVFSRFDIWDIAASKLAFKLPIFVPNER